MDRQKADRKPQKNGDFYSALITEAPFIDAHHSSICSQDLEDPTVIAKGQEFVRRNFFSVVISHFVALLWFIAAKHERVVLLKAGHSHTKKLSTTRYLSTILASVKWYESDYHSILASLYRVRQTHRLVAKNYGNLVAPDLPPLNTSQEKLLSALHADTYHIDDSQCPSSILGEEQEYPLSQFNLAVTLAGFIGTLVLYPQSFGLYDTEGLDGFVHIWTVIGRHVGIDDKYNAALYYEKTGDKEHLRQIMQQLVFPSLKQIDGTSLIMWDVLVQGVRQYAFPIRLLAMVKFMMYGIGLKTAEVTKLMDSSDRFWYGFIVFAAQKMYKWRFARAIRNGFVRLCLLVGKLRFTH